ncbi:MAG: hypothetical protein MRY32_09975 [Rickettsiales bacterium]|nr:hypothetical protein [Rickettsiales bacterium]
MADRDIDMSADMLARDAAQPDSLAELKDMIHGAANAGKHTQPILAEKVEAKLGAALRDFAAELADARGVEVDIKIRGGEGRGA